MAFVEGRRTGSAIQRRRWGENSDGALNSREKGKGNGKGKKRGEKGKGKRESG
jgi:hypothetical protein